MTCTNPAESFLEEFIGDIVVNPITEIRIIVILNKLNKVACVYNKNKSTDSLNNIANDLFECLKPQFAAIEDAVASEIRTALIFIVIATAILIVLIAILFVVLDKSLNYIAIVLLTILFALFYLLACYIFLQHARNNINNTINSNDAEILKCISTADDDLTTFENTNSEAVQLALCSYDSNDPC